MDVVTLQERLAERRPTYVLDIRRAADRRDWSIPGSEWTEAYDALKEGDTSALDALDLPKDQPVVLVCMSGYTADLGARHLRAKGVKAEPLVGGMQAWNLAYNEAETRLSDGTRIVQVRRTGKGCLSHVVESDGEMVVVDANLDASVYEGLAGRLQARIVGVMDTHVHADHLSRGPGLARRLGVPFHIGKDAPMDFRFKGLADGDQVGVGTAYVEALHTPGHTWDSTTYRVGGEAIFTGDTLFTDGVGRPDLGAGKDEIRDRAYALHGSIKRLFDLPATTRVLPAHASVPLPFDGVQWSASLDGIGARVPLVGMDADSFVGAILERLPDVPPTYHRMVLLNRAGDWDAGEAPLLEAGANRCAAG